MQVTFPPGAEAGEVAGLCLFTTYYTHYRRGRLSLRSSPAIRALPVDSPAPASYGYPDELLCRSAFRVMVKRGGSFVEAPSVPGISECEAMKVEMMTELVAQCAQECPK